MNPYTFGAIPARQFPIEVFVFKKTEDFTEIVTAGHDATIEKSAYLFKGPDRFFVAARDKSPVPVEHLGGDRIFVHWEASKNIGLLQARSPSA